MGVRIPISNVFLLNRWGHPINPGRLQYQVEHGHTSPPVKVSLGTSHEVNSGDYVHSLDPQEEGVEWNHEPHLDPTHPKYFLSDGHHRIRAAQQRGESHIDAEVHVPTVPHYLDPEKAAKWNSEINAETAKFNTSQPMKKSEPKQRRVALVIAKRDGLVLFGKRRDNGRWTLPGGHLEEGEEPVAGARRELKEETGLAPAGEMKLVDERELRDVKFYTYECAVDGAPNGKNDPDQECGIWAFFDTKSGIPKDVASNMSGPKEPEKNIAMGLMGLAKGEKPLFAQTAFRHRTTGQIYPSGPMHDYGIFEGNADPELHQLATEGNNLDEYGMVKDPAVESGFLDHAGKFYTRNEARALSGGHGHSDSLQESGHLKKGAMQRLAPFNPQTALDTLEEQDIHRWQRNEGDRAAVPYMQGPARVRALHTLSAKTAARINPETGRREFLLHRGVSPEEHRFMTERGGPGAVDHPAELSSWTPRWSTAKNFAGQYSEGYREHVVSAWVPEDAIHSVPKQYGDLDTPSDLYQEEDQVKPKGANAFGGEHEVVVSPGHHSKLATPEELHAQTRPKESLHGRINDAGHKERQYGSVPDELKVQDLRQRYKKLRAPGAGDMKKREQDDEIDRLLMHPNPSERSMALKLHGVNDKHLTRAFADEDPGIQRAALHHPALGHAALLSLMQMPNRDHLQQLALEHPAISRDHVEALYHTHKDRPVAEKGALMHAIAHHPHLDAPLIEKMVADGNGDATVENLNTPQHVVDQLIEQHLMNPSDPRKRALARRALKHPSAQAHHVERAFKEGPMDVKIAVAQSQHLPEHLAQDVMQRGQLPAGDNEALLRTFIVQNPKATDRHLKTALNDRNPIVRHAARQKTGDFKQYQSEFNKFFGTAMKKAIRAEDFKAIRRAVDPKGAVLVDHKPDLEAHPPQHNADVAAYKHAILDSAQPVKRTSAKVAANSNFSRKVVYTVPATHATHGGARYMVKPYHENVPTVLSRWQKHPHQGWAEMTNQALYHAGGIGHLHQNVHTVEHHMGEGHEAEPALVVKMDHDFKPLQSYRYGSMYLGEPVKHDARRIAMMDFLSNNLDRHGGNIMVGDFKPHPDEDIAQSGVDVPNKLLAIDHSRSFQYINTHEHKYRPRRDQPRQLEDNFGNYASNYSRGSVLRYLAPVEGNQFMKQDPHQWAADWGPVFDWWGQNSGNIKAAMAKRLDQIKDPEVRKHIQRNFDARTRYLDERADLGIENYGDDWYKHPVEQYRPGELTDAEKEQLAWEREYGDK